MKRKSESGLKDPPLEILINIDIIMIILDLVSVLFFKAII